MALSENDRYLNTTEAATYTGRGISTFAKERMAGRGPAYVKIGRSVRYLRSELDEFMRAHTNRHAGAMEADRG